LVENPLLFEDSLDSELEALSYEPDKEVGKDTQPELGKEDLDAAASLRKRIDEVRASERGRALSDILYLMVCDGFRRVGYPLSRPLQAGGRADLGVPAKEETLTSKLHSNEVLEAVEEHMAQSMPGGMAAASSSVLQQMVQLPFFNIGQAYALTVQYGYVLKRAESRLQLERSLQPDRAGSKPLGSYIKAIGPGIFQDAMLSVEAHIASKMQVDAVFGDLQVLRGHLVNALAKRKPSRSGTSAAVQDAVNSGEVAAIYILVADVRRLLLEAAAFGAFLWQAEDKALELSTPTLTKQSRLSDFGVQADSDGNPVLPE